MIDLNLSGKRAVVTGASFQVQTSEVIRSSIKFVTTGPFKYGIGTPAYELLKEDLEFLLQEDDARVALPHHLAAAGLL